MNIVYTYYTNGVKNLDCGFGDLNLFLECAKKSLKSALKQDNLDNVVIYTDNFGYEFLLNNLDFDYIGNCDKLKVEFVNYSQYDFDERFWNFPKMITYTLQNSAFVHIDFDVILDKDFLVYMGNQDIVTEKIRYNYRTIGREKDCLDEFDTCGKMQFMTICSGLIGANTSKGIELFKENFETAKEYCKGGKHSEVDFTKLWGIEEYNFTKLVKEKKLSVFEINKNTYIHFQGKNKYERYKDLIYKLKV